MSRNEVDVFIIRSTAFQKRICQTPESALAYLIKLGTHNTDGSLSENYGGIKMDRVSEAVKKIDELIRQATEDQRLDRRTMSPLKALRDVRKILTEHKQTA